MSQTSVNGRVAEREPALTRRELRFLERERQILDAAREILIKDGLPGLTMERIAEAINYGRTTVYEHFPCKEEIITEITHEAVRLHLKLYDRVLQFDARPRERMVAVGEVSTIVHRWYPRHFITLLLSYTNVMRDKISPERTQAGIAFDSRVRAIVEGIIRDGVAVGDLVLAEGVTPEQINAGLWYLTVGGYAFVSTDAPLAQSGVAGPIPTLRLIGNAVLDGLGWRPLSTEWDYRETMRRIYTEVFPPEVIEEVLS
jgi:AcrR family transcriptional regulator